MWPLRGILPGPGLLSLLVSHPPGFHAPILLIFMRCCAILDRSVNFSIATRSAISSVQWNFPLSLVFFQNVSDSKEEEERGSQDEEKPEEEREGRVQGGFLSTVTSSANAILRAWRVQMPCSAQLTSILELLVRAHACNYYCMCIRMRLRARARQELGRPDSPICWLSGLKCALTRIRDHLALEAPCTCPQHYDRLLFGSATRNHPHY